MHNTSHVEGEPYGNLLREKGFGGFPTMAYLDAEGEVLTSSMPRSVEGFQKVHGALGAEQAFAAKAKAGKLSPTDTAKWLLARIDLGKVQLDAAQTEYASIEGKLSADLKKEIAPKLIDLEFAQVMTAANAASRARKPREEVTAEVTAKLKAMLEAKKIPSDASAFNFWAQLLQAGKRDGDEALEARAKTELEALASRDPSKKTAVERVLNPPVRRESVPAAKIKQADGGK